MNDTVIIAIISFLGTLVGTAGGIITSAKLTQYRLEQLEKKVEAQSRSFSDLPILKERITNISRRVANLEKHYSTTFSYKDYFDTESS